MRALIYYGPRDLRMADMPDPQPGEGDVLIRVKASGICGSDVHGYLGTTGRRTPPMIMGHEFAGKVAAIGKGVKSVCLGDRVTVQPMIFCGKCDMCRNGLTTRCPDRKMFGVMAMNGSMAEYVSVPERLIYVLPESVDFVHGALLEPLAVAYSAVRRAGDCGARNALVVGVGAIGLMVVQVLRALSPKTRIIAIDVNSHRLALALEMGVDRALSARSPDEVKRGIAEETGGEGVDLSFEAVGMSATVQQALGSLRNGGTCIWVGNSAKMIELNMQEAVTRELEIRGTYAYTHAAFGEALGIMANGKLNVEPLISKVVRLEEGPEFFEKLATGQDNLVKVILTE